MVAGLLLEPLRRILWPGTCELLQVGGCSEAAWAWDTHGSSIRPLARASRCGLPFNSLTHSEDRPGRKLAQVCSIACPGVRLPETCQRGRLGRAKGVLNAHLPGLGGKVCPSMRRKPRCCPPCRPRSAATESGPRSAWLGRFSPAGIFLHSQGVGNLGQVQRRHPTGSGLGNPSTSGLLRGFFFLCAATVQAVKEVVESLVAEDEVQSDKALAVCFQS